MDRRALLPRPFTAELQKLLPSEFFGVMPKAEVMPEAGGIGEAASKQICSSSTSWATKLHHLNENLGALKVQIALEELKAFRAQLSEVKRKRDPARSVPSHTFFRKQRRRFLALWRSAAAHRQSVIPT